MYPALMKCEVYPIFFVLLVMASCAGPKTEMIAMSGINRQQVQAPAKQAAVPQASKPRLPLKTVFKGEAKFQAILAKAERENWRKLPIGERTVRIAREMHGTPYVNYTLEIDDRIESPVVNLGGLDCWTYYENAVAISRLIAYKPGPYRPEDLLHMIEIERYRDGKCTGNYLSRMHHLEEVFFDNQRRGYAVNITPRIPGAERLSREIREMTVSWKSYRYLKNNRELIPAIGRIEAQVSQLPFYHIPKSKVRIAENYFQNGDVCAISSKWKYGYTSHVGLIGTNQGPRLFQSRDIGSG